MLARIHEVIALGEVVLPKVANSGREFHLLEIAAARGGNAVPNCDYYAIVIDGTNAWGSQSFSARSCAEEGTPSPFESVFLVEGSSGASLSFVEPATTMAAGTVYQVTMGLLKRTRRIPKLPRSIVSDEEVVLSGTLNPPVHVMNWHHSIDSARETVAVDVPGRCKLDPFVGTYVEMNARRRTWSDNASEVTCLAVRRASP